MSAASDAILGTFRDAGVLGPLDVHFAAMLGRLTDTGDPLALLGAAMASRAPGEGHVCAELATLATTVRVEGREGQLAPVLRWPAPDAWLAALRAAPFVGRGTDDATPLVLRNGRLYLTRYWHYQERLVAALVRRAEAPRDDVDLPLLREGLARLFPSAGDDPHDLQRLAAAMAVLRSLAVVSGGPGTGKTTTVVRFLALLLEQAAARAARGEGRFPLRVALVAPTGKAAARMTEAIRKNKRDLATSAAVLAAIPEEAATLHRRLGYRPDHPTRFRHDAEHPLPVDVVVVDEASMVDLALMTKLVEAVPPQARLVLLGDRDQLASVEAGAVLGDICNAGFPRPGFSPAFAATLAAAVGPLPAGLSAPTPPPPVADTIVHLTRTYRFGPRSGIGALAEAINGADAARALDILAQGGPTGRFPDVALVPLATPDELAGALRGLVLAGYAPCARAASPEEALRALECFRVLAAHRRGRLGVEGLVREIERWLATAGLVRPGGGPYEGQPVLVTENDYGLGLFNGDTGIVRRDAEGHLRAYFPHASGSGVRTFHPGRLPAHETVYATTVHKAQGSEADHVLLVLPSRPSPVLTRELLYTAVTRARQRVTIAGSAEVFAAGIRERVQRSSGLRAALWGDPTSAR